MSNPSDADQTPIESARQLADYIAAGCKPAAAFRIGTEHEKFGFRRDTYAPPPYDDEPNGEPNGEPYGKNIGATVKAMLERLRTYGEAEPILDHGQIIGLKQSVLPGHGASISLEPAGQLELSGAPLETLHQTAEELDRHLAQVGAESERMGLGYAPLGFHPVATRAEMPWMPKGRYAIMRRYMPKVGGMGLDMMTRTCTVQVNLDYASEADMARKLRVALALQPLATALFANSPIVEGRESGFLSYRAHVWTDTDKARSGIPAVMLEPGFGFERYVAWLIDCVPMYFIYRNNEYIDVAGASFRDFLDGKLAAAEGARGGIMPVLGDFSDHMTTAFTDVRLKRFIEMRGADAGSPAMMTAQSALWVGLLYDGAALEAAYSLVKSVTHAALLQLRADVPRQGLDAVLDLGGRPVSLRALLPEILGIARSGLAARARLDAGGRDETIYLAPVEAIAAGAPTQAEHWLGQFRGVWRGDALKMLDCGAI
jgi:glutamate--cysteine ligase